MKISEMINKLNELKNMYGDIPVVILDYLDWELVDIEDSTFEYRDGDKNLIILS